MQIGLLRWRGRGGASWVNARYVFVYTCLCHSVPVFSFVRWRYRLLLPAFAFIFLHPRGPDHWSPLSWGRRACPGYRYGICSTFFARPPSCSCPKSGPSLPLGVFPFRFNSPQSSNSFFPSFFPQLPFLLQVESSHVSCFFLLCFLFPSFGSRLSFFPFFPGYSPSTPLSTFTLYPADFLLSSPISLPLPLPLPPCLHLVIQRSHSWTDEKHNSQASFPTHVFCLPFTKLQGIVRQPFITAAELHHVTPKHSRRS